MATLSVGGNDIDFPGIIFNCILETHLPGGAGPPARSCEEQKKVTWDLLISPDLEENIAGTIKKVVDKGQSGTIGDNFRLYVTGFPQFFSEETDECDSVTFARTANPNPDGKDHTMMTQENRKEFNSMSVQLNKAIAAAVSRFPNDHVSWISIDDSMQGHRYCEPGVKEPDQQNQNLWLYHYPYNEAKDDSLDDALLAAFENVTKDVNINTAYPKYSDFQNAMFEALEDPGTDDFRDGIFSRVGARVKVFHPQIALHEKIRDLVLHVYASDLEDGNTEQPPAPTKPDENKCHGISGDYWVMSRDTAVENVKAFCGQSEKTVKYNEGSVNELELSLRDLDDDTKGPSDSPDCIGRFQGSVIDGCDGDDSTNNPHNYKFGSTLTTGDGWEYTMTPLSKQVNEVSCDVSYKFFFDSFEIRGKNLPDAKMGANGEGLESELSGCGLLTKWNFERTPDDVKFQWYATGQLPIGTKACVGRALISAGGADNGNCHGAGKRELFGIEAWPGYGDDSKHVFKNSPAESSSVGKRASIDAWPGYGEASKHVFKQPATD